MSVVKVLKEKVQLSDVGPVEVSARLGGLVHQAMVVAPDRGGTIRHVRHQVTLPPILVKVRAIFEVAV